MRLSPDDESAFQSQPSTLHLTLHKQPFDQIVSGEKTEEYRENTAYWSRRLWRDEKPRKFDYVCFRNGYRADSPKVVCKWRGTRLDASTNKFVIELAKLE